MKEQLKQVAIAFVVIALGVLALIGGSRWIGDSRWIGRSRDFAQIIPVAPEELVRCEVRVDSAEGDVHLRGDLTSEALEQLMERLGQSQYRSRLSNFTSKLFGQVITGHAVTIDPYARLLLESQEGVRLELILCGDVLLVNTLQGSTARDGNYNTVEGPQFQQELVEWLAEQENMSETEN